MRDQLDKAIGTLLAHLDARGIDYAVMLSADHGGLDMPERAGQQAVPRAVRVDAALSTGELAKAVTARTGTAADKKRVWPVMTAQWPDYDKYQAGTSRDIPVVLLRPR